MILFASILVALIIIAAMYTAFTFMFELKLRERDALFWFGIIQLCCITALFAWVIYSADNSAKEALKKAYYNGVSIEVNAKTQYDSNCDSTVIIKQDTTFYIKGFEK